MIPKIVMINGCHLFEVCGVVGYRLDPNTGSRKKREEVTPDMLSLTPDDQECHRISRMSSEELLEYVISNPSYLSDGYYRDFGAAILKRYQEL